MAARRRRWWCVCVLGGEGSGYATRKDTVELEGILKDDVPRLRRQFARAIGDGRILDTAL